MNVPLKTKYLAAALECAAKNDIRYYLNGVCVDFVNSTELVYCATEGNILFAAKDVLKEPCGILTGFQLIIPTEVIKTALKDFKKAAAIELVHLHAAFAQGTWRLGNTIFQAIDGKFPDYNRVIPKEVSGYKACYDPELLVKVYKAIQLITNEPPTLQQNGDSVAVLQIFKLNRSGGEHENVICLIMPWRQQLESYRPWCSPVTAEALAA